MPATAPPARPVAGRTDGHVAAILRWSGVGLLLFLLSAAWAVAMPLMAGPDEPSHVIWAAAVARGEMSGTLGAGARDASRTGSGTTVDLPTDYGPAASLPNCFAFHPEASADCQQDVAPPVPGALQGTETFAGQYPPLYYALVGWPSRFLHVEASVYAMRLVSAALTALLTTWGVWRLSRAFGRGWATWGAVVAITPMSLFIGGVVNPQALEISAAFAFWAACLAFARGPTPAPRSAYVQAGVCGALLVNTRATSPLWAVVIVAVALVIAPRGRWRQVIAPRAARVVGAAAVVAAAAAVGWLAVHPVVSDDASTFPEYRNPVRVAAAVGSHTLQYLHDMIGNFGWLDSPAPVLTVTIWLVAGGTLVVLAAAARGSARQRIGLVLLLAAVLAAPVVTQVPTAHQIGLIWQGRYGLPIAVGLPLVAVVVLLGERADVRDVARRTGRLLVPLVAVAHVAAFWWAERRYAVGANGKVLTLSPHWTSPLGYLSAVALYAALVLALAVPAWLAMRRGVPAPVDGAADATGLGDEAATGERQTAGAATAS